MNPLAAASYHEGRDYKVYREPRSTLKEPKSTDFDETL